MILYRLLLIGADLLAGEQLLERLLCLLRGGFRVIQVTRIGMLRLHRNSVPTSSITPRAPNINIGSKENGVDMHTSQNLTRMFHESEASPLYSNRLKSQVEILAHHLI